jgi:hypothetical protein
MSHEYDGRLMKLIKNCGSGAGGFQEGNTCGAGGGGSVAETSRWKDYKQGESIGKGSRYYGKAQLRSEAFKQAVRGLKVGRSVDLVVGEGHTEFGKEKNAFAKITKVAGNAYQVKTRKDYDVLRDVQIGERVVTVDTPDKAIQAVEDADLKKD